LGRACGSDNVIVVVSNRSSSSSRENARIESQQNYELKGAIRNRLGGEAELDISDDQNPNVNTLPQTEDVSLEYIFSLKINGTVSRKTYENYCHRDFS
jgi:hypothetical protein